MIRSTQVDRVLLHDYLLQSPEAKDWVSAASGQVPWFGLELLEDFFFCFYLAKPEIDAGREADPFHRWLVGTLRKQYFYRMIHPRTTGQLSASFKTAVKSLMWLTNSFREEEARKKKAESQPAAGMDKKRQQGPDSTRAQMNERLSKEQIEQLQLVGFTLHQGKKVAEEKQAALDSRPLVESEIAELKERIVELQEEMRREFMKRDKLRAKLKLAQEELARRQRQFAAFERRDSEAFAALEEELGHWLNRSLKMTLSEEERDSLNVHELLEASQRIANRRWGSELGRLRRQPFERYLEWVEKLKRHPDLIEFLSEIGRSLHQLRARRRKRKAERVPEAYDDLRQSSDITHMLPSEASLLADEEFEAYFALKWLEGKLMTYNVTGTLEEPQKGPVVCMIDTSHSMKGAKLKLAQLFVMTFAAFTLSERRDFVLLLFGARGELQERALYHRRPNWPAFYALAQLAFGGGTHFDAPLERAAQLVGGTPAFHDADLVMVTDGVGHVSPAMRDRLAELGKRKSLRLHTLIVGSARQHLAASYDILGVSHRVRFAATWESQDAAKDELLLDAVARRKKPGSPS